MQFKQIDWVINYRAMFGPISNQQAEAWEKFVTANVNAYHDGDMDRAVASLCSTWKSEFGSKPGVKDICSRIFQMRGGGNTSSGHGRPQHVNEAVEDRKRRIRVAKGDAAAVWNIICEQDIPYKPGASPFATGSFDVCKELHDYALSIWPEFVQPVFPSLFDMLKLAGKESWDRERNNAETGRHRADRDAVMIGDTMAIGVFAAKPNAEKLLAEIHKTVPAQPNGPDFSDHTGEDDPPPF